MPTCPECRFCIGDLRCAHPTVVNHVTGALAHAKCEHVRAADGRCGPEGCLFEVKARDYLYDRAPSPQAD